MTIEFSRTLTQDEQDLLVRNREELMRNDSTKAIWQNRVKKASETHLELKALYTDPVTGEIDELFPDWQTFRDNFILDWINNRTIVTEEEAEKMFERTADEALAALEQNGSTEVTTSTEPSAVAMAVVAGNVEESAPVVSKRRGRPAGTKVKASAVVKSKVKSAKKKAVAKKAVGGSKSAKAQKIIETYAAREWSRKDILVKLQAQLDIGVAYAATLYQKFA